LPLEVSNIPLDVHMWSPFLNSPPWKIKCSLVSGRSKERKAIWN